MKTKRTAALVCAALISLSALTSCRAGKTEYSDSDYFVMNANMKLRLASSGASDDVLNSGYREGAFGEYRGNTGGAF